MSRTRIQERYCLMEAITAGRRWQLNNEVSDKETQAEQGLERETRVRDGRFMPNEESSIYNPLTQPACCYETNASDHACRTIRAVHAMLYRLPHFTSLPYRPAAQNGLPCSSSPHSSSPCPNPKTLFTFPTLLRTAFLGCAPIPIPSPAAAAWAWLAFSASLFGGHSPSFFHPTTRELTTSFRFMGMVGARPWMTILL